MAALLFISFIVLLLIGVPVAFAIAAAALLVLLKGDVKLLILVQRMFASTDSFSLIAVPFFIFAGDLLAKGKVSKVLVEFAESLLGMLKGGLSIVSVLAGMFFAAISGSGAATTAAVGATLIPELKKRGYREDSAAALIAAAGTIGVVIPPSVPMVLYAVISEDSVNTLFKNGFVPGILMGVILVAISLYQARKFNYPKGKAFSVGNVLHTFKEAIWGILMPLIILGGIFSGYFTPSEAAAVAVIYAIFVSFFIYRDLDFKGLVEIMKGSAKTSAVIMIIIACSGPFGWVLANYKIPEAAKALQSFVDDMSNWYVRRSRERFWAKGMEQDKINAYMTLYTALVTISKAAAPMIPFMTEDIYQNLVRSIDANAPESIHLCDFPKVNEAHIDKELEENMDRVLKLVVMGRACRNTANIKNRQPIGQMYVKADFELSEFFDAIVADELNVKNVTFTQEVRDFTSYSFKPQLKTVGPKYGKLLGGIKNVLSGLDGNAAMDELNANGCLRFEVNGEEVVLNREDLLIDTAQMEGYVSESDYGITVVLDTNLTEELLTEGFVREIISKIQTMRKEAGFEVMDKIKVTYDGSEKAEKVFAEYAEQIGQETLAVAVEKAEPAGYVKDWKINGEAVNMGVEKQGE